MIYTCVVVEDCFCFSRLHSLLDGNLFEGQLLKDYYLFHDSSLGMQNSRWDCSICSFGYHP